MPNPSTIETAFPFLGADRPNVVSIERPKLRSVLKGQDVVYLVHFHKPLQHARHYLGFTSNLRGRLHLHRKGRGSSLMAAVAAAGTPWHVSRIWLHADRAFERTLKDRSHVTTLCPVCRKATQAAYAARQRAYRAAKKHQPKEVA